MEYDQQGVLSTPTTSKSRKITPAEPGYWFEHIVDLLRQRGAPKDVENYEWVQIPTQPANMGLAVRVPVKVSDDGDEVDIREVAVTMQHRCIMGPLSMSIGYNQRHRVGVVRFNARKK